MERVNAKWGFGNAPLKAEQYAKTVSAIDVLRQLLADAPAVASDAQLEAVSHIKGQFNRTIRQDQWDWCTVWMLLGRPSGPPARRIVERLTAFRGAIKNGDRDAAASIATQLGATGLDGYLERFLEGDREPVLRRGASGYIYILSTRSQPTMLKIGATQRSVDARVREINSATGVAVPFGIRGVWEVDDAFQVEADIHGLLAEHRIRVDREFFDLEFDDAKGAINAYLAQRRRRGT